jgi:hypothetical protein
MIGQLHYGLDMGRAMAQEAFIFLKRKNPVPLIILF